MAGGRVLTLRELNRATLARQMLLERERVAPLKAIERLVAIQAQLPRPPFIGLWTRLESFDRAAMRRLFLDRKAVRGTFLRATIHVASAADFVAFHPVIRPGLEANMKNLLRDRIANLDLDALVRRAARTLAKQPQTFEDLRESFRKEDPDGDERAMAYAIRMLLPTVQVPDANERWAFPARACFTTAEAWLGREVPSRRPAPDDLVLRYLGAYGPATVRDFQTWAGLSPVNARDAFERLRPRLEVFRDEQKREIFDLPDAPRPGPDVDAPVRFVPDYDNLIIGRSDERFVSKADRPRVFLPNLRIVPTVLVDGFAAASWRLDAKKKGATVIVSPFRTFTRKVQRAIEQEAEALAGFAEPDAARIDVTFES